MARREASDMTWNGLETSGIVRTREVAKIVLRTSKEHWWRGVQTQEMSLWVRAVREAIIFE